MSDSILEISTVDFSTLVGQPSRWPEVNSYILGIDSLDKKLKKLDSDGVLEVIGSSALAINGVSNIGSAVALGGVLTQQTTITLGDESQEYFFDINSSNNDPSVRFTIKQLYQEGFPSVDWGARTLSTIYGPSLNWGNRILNDTNLQTTIDWELGYMYNSGDNSVSAKWKDRLLTGYLEETTVAWGDYSLMHNDNTSVDWASKTLRYFDNATSINETSVDWSVGTLSKTSSIPVLDWFNETLNSSLTENIPGVSYATSIDWKNRTLVNDWNKITCDWNNNTLSSYDFNADDYRITIDWEICALQSYNETPMLNWSDQQIRSYDADLDPGNLLSIDWLSRTLVSNKNQTEEISIDWNERFLYDINENIVLDWSDGISYGLYSEVCTDPTNEFSLVNKTYVDTRLPPNASYKTIHVDALGGNDQTAIPYNSAARFATILTAVSTAVSGDTIHIHPGLYTDYLIPMKHGLTLHFAEGAVLQPSANGGAVKVFQLTTSALGTFTITGFGRIISKGFNGGGTVTMENGYNTQVNITCKEFSGVSQWQSGASVTINNALVNYEIAIRFGNAVFNNCIIKDCKTTTYNMDWISANITYNGCKFIRKDATIPWEVNNPTLVAGQGAQGLNNHAFGAAMGGGNGSRKTSFFNCFFYNSIGGNGITFKEQSWWSTTSGFNPTLIVSGCKFFHNTGSPIVADGSTGVPTSTPSFFFDNNTSNTDPTTINGGILTQQFSGTGFQVNSAYIIPNPEPSTLYL